MKKSARLVLMLAALALVSSNAFAEHSEVDTYYGPTGAATVAHVNACGGPEHTGGACFVQFDEGDEVTIAWEDAVIDQTGYMIAFRPASGADLLRLFGCMNRGEALGPIEIPEGTNRIVVFLGYVLNQADNSLVCEGAPQPTTGTVTATYLS